MKVKTRCFPIGFYYTTHVRVHNLLPSGYLSDICNMKRRVFETVLLFLLVSGAVWSQQQPQPQAGAGAAPAPATAGGVDSLPHGFSSIELGQTMAEVERNLKEDPNFDYRGSPDVSLLPQQDRKLIETAGNVFVERAFFQFYEDRLYIIILQLNGQRVDHYSMYRTLVRKYGDPNSLSPAESVWLSEAVRMSLERPLTVKYVDRQVFDQLRESGKMEQSVQELSRTKFLEQF